ncbi:hypothetical protein EJ07DRAFT_158224 [Lizonia empirigonia]|nr:hypothetical protein EJ07DRAFT_158224 [Lizonia empirigonia]
MSDKSSFQDGWQKVRECRAAAEAAGLLDDPVMRRNLAQLEETLEKLEQLQENECKHEVTIGHGKRDQHDRGWEREAKLKVCGQVGLPPKTWRETFDELEQRLDEIEKDLDELECDAGDCEEGDARDECDVSDRSAVHWTQCLNEPAGSVRQSFRFSKILLPAGFTLPLDITHADSSTLRTAAYVYNFATGTSLDNFHTILQLEAKVHLNKAVITPILSLKHKHSLQDAVEQWWRAMDVEAGIMDTWSGFRKGDTYIVSQTLSPPRPTTNHTPLLRGGAPDFEPISIEDDQSFAKDFERIYDDLLKQNAEACGSSAPSPCTEAWMKLASLLQMRNSYLEHQVRELHETNESLTGDVEWLVDALDKVEDRLREAQYGHAAALAEVLDLKVRVACSTKGQESDDGVSNDGDIAYTDMTSSDPDARSVRDIERMRRSTAQDIDPGYPPPIDAPNLSAKPFSSPPAQGFYFYPSSSIITVMTEIPQSIQWPPGTSLPEIRDDLIFRHEHGVENEFHLAAILEIMDERENLGVQLPGPTRDEVIWIGIPDIHGPRGMNDGVKLDAWRSCDTDPDAVGCNGTDLFAGFSWDTDCAGETNVPAALLRRSCGDSGVDSCSMVSPHTTSRCDSDLRHKHCHD